MWLYRSFQPIVERFIDTPDITPMLEHIEGNILILGEQGKETLFQKMSFATNFKTGVAAAFEKVDALHQIFHNDPDDAQRKLHIVSVVGPENTIDTIKLAELNHKYSAAETVDIVYNQSVYEGVTLYLNEHEIDVLALYLPQRNIIGKLAHYHLTRDLIHKTDYPILLVMN
jgi:hypothetical protein